MADPSLENRLFLLDGSSLAYRAFFALPESIATRDGFPTNAIYGLSQMLLKIVTEYRPASIVVAWDAREKTFRHEEFEEYKAQRPHMPEPLSQQWERFPELMEAFGIVNLVQPGVRGRRHPRHAGGGGQAAGRGLDRRHRRSRRACRSSTTTSG